MEKGVDAVMVYMQTVDGNAVSTFLNESFGCFNGYAKPFFLTERRVPFPHEEGGKV